MKRILLRHLSLYTRRFLSPIALKPRPNANSSALTSLSPSLFLKLRPLSSKAGTKSNSAPTQKEQSPADEDDVSTEELRRRIDKYFEGDDKAIPSIFEAILKRKLSGKHDESDDELMQEFRGKPPEDVSDKEFDSDGEEWWDKPLEDVSDKEFDSDEEEFRGKPLEDVSDRV
ncbi:Ankyrin repeat domain-containing protein [Actinidia chinensis var. chinensis]|uniref:Ankyrin repeat domain-containing protein n=1 Tax=Actinidia chinensis var. chinensis TaxID=1590841 RepID=A0A2R6PU19_ACTCC|nr:Ankyrin repeat domain-containing protein [Actinidia chinensis var. chinensis]